ncbi:MAG: radical SAM/SPASM domain-containing protein [Myxococcota bacterium]
MNLGQLGAIARGVARVEVARRLGRPVIPYRLEFITTFACESRCRTCNIWKRYIEAPEDRELELSVDDIVRTAASARRYVRWISLTGGEVTDRPDLPHLVARLVSEMDGRLAMLQFTTNGIDPDRTEAMFREIARLTRGIPTYVSVSLDGLGRTYERVRGVPDGFRRVRRSMERLQRLSREERHVTVGHEVTLSKFNAPEAQDLFAAATVGGKQPIVTLATDAFQLTRGQAGVDVREGGAPIRRALSWLRRNYRVRSPEDLLPKLHLELTRQYLRSGEAPLRCLAGHASLTVDPYGRVLQCDSRERALARLQDFDFDVVRMCRAPGFREALAPDTDCRDCWTPCQAYPTLMHRPVEAMRRTVREAIRAE